MKEFAFAVQAARYFNEFKLNVMQCAIIRRVLSEKLCDHNARIDDLNKDAEHFIANEDLINRIHEEAVDIENIMSYMQFIQNGDKTWTTKRQKGH